MAISICKASVTLLHCDVAPARSEGGELYKIDNWKSVLKDDEYIQSSSHGYLFPKKRKKEKIFILWLYSTCIYKVLVIGWLWTKQCPFLSKMVNIHLPSFNQLLFHLNEPSGFYILSKSIISLLGSFLISNTAPMKTR